MNRRHFLRTAAGVLFVAPAIVRADSLMKVIVPPKPKLIGSVDVYVSDFHTVNVVPADDGLTEEMLRSLLNDLWQAGGKPQQVYRVQYPDDWPASSWPGRFRNGRH